MGVVAGSVLNDCRALAGSGSMLPCQEPIGQRSERIEAMMQELFRLHDLNSNGTLEEVELMKLNEKIAILHCGEDADRAHVRSRFSGIFRAELDPDGQPVAYSRFRRYMFRMLDNLDNDEPTQAMIMEQFIAEADLAIASFPRSLKARPGFLAALPPPMPRPPQAGANFQAWKIGCQPFQRLRPRPSRPSIDFQNYGDVNDEM
eukprot:TRINITY_DN17512_c0_g1_i1.p1 TRINITY_DN17512_c0_g1~~TRINITY_DN17512_c0_g1_i1.p1  ORF type:complete len:203 (+),score=37.33 TRINITY_DN17512_c0_g1_i1:35-643(+)